MEKSGWDWRSEQVRGMGGDWRGCDKREYKGGGVKEGVTDGRGW